MVNIDYLYHPDAVKNRLTKNYFINKKLGFQIIENGIVLPHKDIFVDKKWTWGKGGIIDSNGEFIKSSHAGDCAILYNSRRQVSSIYPPPRESIQHRHETVIYSSIFFHVWGHVLTDNIRRLWFLNNDVFRNEFKNCPIIYIPWDEGKYTVDRMPDFKRLLEILGVDLNRLQPIMQPTQFDKIILFDEAFFLNGFTNEYREMIDRVRSFALKNRTPTSSKKIYFYYGKKQIGEERLAEYFKSKGYEIITHKQRLNFDEELNLLINAESFASSEGSCTHNSLFLRDGTESIIIPRISSNNYANSYQFILNQVNSLNVNYIDSTLSIFNVAFDSFCFIISKQLKEFFGDNWNGYEEEDFKAFLEYVNSPSLRKGREINSVYKNKGSDAILTDFMIQLKRRKDLIAAYNMPSDWDKFQSQFTYITFVRQKSWNADSIKFENQISNPLNQQLEILTIRLNYPRHKVYYSVYYNEEEGWTKEVSNDEWAGVIDERKPIYGMKVRFDEASAKERDILYRMHKFDGTWTPWAKNGEALYSHGQKVNAIQMKLEPINIQPDETEEFDDMYSPWLENEATIYLQGQRALIRAKTIKTQSDKTRTNEFDDVYTPWAKSDETIYLSGRRPQLIAKIKKDVI